MRLGFPTPRRIAMLSEPMQEASQSRVLPEAPTSKSTSRKVWLTLLLTPFDDNKFYLGINFLGMVKVFLVPYTNTTCIIEMA